MASTSPVNPPTRAAQIEPATTSAAADPNAKTRGRGATAPRYRFDQPPSRSSRRERECRSTRAAPAGNAVGWRPRDTERMKLQATIVISYRADSFGDAGDALDDVLQRARERDDVEIDSIQLGAPASAGPVSIPYVERPPAPPQRVPHPLPNGERN
jgi:hypothetical protein